MRMAASGRRCLDGGDEPAIGAVDARGVADDLGDAHVGDVFGADDAVLAGVVHLAAAKSEERGVGERGAEVGDDLRAIVISAGLAG